MNVWEISFLITLAGVIGFYLGYKVGIYADERKRLKL